jgi:TonB family protein
METVKTTIGFTFLMVLSSICYGQDTVYYDYAAKRTTDVKEAIDYCIFTAQPDQTFYGKDYSVKENKLIGEGYYSSIDPIVLDGHYVYYENGAITKEGDYVHNKQHGKWTLYRPGTKKIWCTESYGKSDHVKLRSYYENGRLKRKEKHNSTLTQASGKCRDEKGKKTFFTPFYTPPKPPYSIERYLSENIKYPDKARVNSIAGVVLIRFAIDGNGKISNAEVIKSVGGGCNEEALRVVSVMPNWEPGVQDDVPIKVFFTLPITFNYQ